MSCVLRAGGERFEIDAFMKDTRLCPYKIWHRGERRFPNSARNTKCNESSGLAIDVSKRGFDDLPGQIEDAIAFLREHHDQLKHLVEYAGVEGVRLDFGHHLRIGRNVACQFDYLPPALVRAAGILNIGIELSLYPPADEDNEA